MGPRPVIGLGFGLGPRVNTGFEAPVMASDPKNFDLDQVRPPVGTFHDGVRILRTDVEVFYCTPDSPGAATSHGGRRWRSWTGASVFGSRIPARGRVMQASE